MLHVSVTSSVTIIAINSFLTITRLMSSTYVFLSNSFHLQINLISLIQTYKPMTQNCKLYVTQHCQDKTTVWFWVKKQDSHIQRGSPSSFCYQIRI
jgi:hypothetical protein